MTCCVRPALLPACVLGNLGPEDLEAHNLVVGCVEVLDVLVVQGRQTTVAKDRSVELLMLLRACDQVAQEARGAARLGRRVDCYVQGQKTVNHSRALGVGRWRPSENILQAGLRSEDLVSLVVVLLHR